jgi:hypothetical protein
MLNMLYLFLIEVWFPNPLAVGVKDQNPTVFFANSLRLLYKLNLIVSYLRLMYNNYEQKK